jgi:extradiol dioxygenase family protein
MPTQKTSPLFHLAFPVTDLAEARTFYIDGLGCLPGRSADSALILNLGGHQIVAQHSALPSRQDGIYPRHFGLIFPSRREWKALYDRAVARGLPVYQKPRIRFPATRLAHDSFFLQDPSGNLLEFKHYKYRSAIFGERGLSKIGETKTRAKPEK